MSLGSISRLTLRIVIGGLFVGHGTQKLFGMFGGSGLAGTDQVMEQLRLHPPRANALAAGVSEAAGGHFWSPGWPRRRRPAA
jgi:putative oxidoreductase